VARTVTLAIAAMLVLVVGPGRVLADGTVTGVENRGTRDEGGFTMRVLVLDLAAAAVESTIEVTDASGVELKMASRLPGRAYRVRWPWKDMTREMRLRAASLDGRATYDCPDARVPLEALRDTSNESEVRGLLQRFRAALGSCRETRFVQPNELEPTVYSDIKLEGAVRLQIERLDANGTADRTWTVNLRRGLPTSWKAADENTWIVREVASRILTLAGHAGAPAVTPAGDLTWRVSAAGLASPVEVRLAPHAWAPAAFEPLARAAFGAPQTSAARVDVVEALLTPTSTTLVAQDDALSKALAASPRAPQLHEQAALLVASFALREMFTYGDERAALNHLAAHLASARALRRGGSPTSAGKLAEAALLVLLGRTAEADAALRAFAGNQPAEVAWRRALQARATGDWRVLEKLPQLSLLEQRELAVALALRVSSARAFAELRERKPLFFVDWGRILLSIGPTVDVSNALAPGRFQGELAERAEVLRALGEREPGDVKALIARAPDPQRRVLPRALWDDAVQRGLVAAVSHLDGHLARQGLSEPRQQLRRMAGEQLATLDLMPLLDLHWSAYPLEDGPATPDQAARACAAVRRLLADQRERVPEYAMSNYRSRCLDDAAFTEWAPAAAAGTTLHGLSRFQESSKRNDRGETERVLRQLVTLDPWDTDALLWATGQGVLPDTIFAPVAAYDARLAGALADRHRDTPAYVTYARQHCQLDSDQCWDLANSLLAAGREAEAEDAFERALADAGDLVAASHQTRWLVERRIATGRQAAALQLAEQMASTGSGPGLITHARALEQLGRLEEAERVLQGMVERYPPNADVLAAFYVRHAGGPYAAQAAAALAKVFPGGPPSVRIRELSAPKAPFTIVSDVDPVNRGALEAAGLKGGAVLVAVNGYRVVNEEQFYVAQALRPGKEISLIWWDGKRMHERSFKPLADLHLALQEVAAPAAAARRDPPDPQRAMEGQLDFFSTGDSKAAFDALSSPDVEVRRRAAQFVLGHPDFRAEQMVPRLMADSDRQVRSTAIGWLIDLGPKEQWRTRILRELTRDADDRTATIALIHLGREGAREAIPDIRKAMERTPLRAAALEALTRLGEKP
jgi:tetratricopeptide (TPR) repeat protein